VIEFNINAKWADRETVTFDYGIPAELFMGKRKGGPRQPLRYRRFATAAEAIRFAPNGPSQKWWLGPFHLDTWLKGANLWRKQTNLRTGSKRLSDISLKVMWKKQRTSTFSHHRRVKRADGAEARREFVAALTGERHD
jgi:hypothetical protein